MGERKVQAKYYPPDFDPTKLPPAKKKRVNDDAVRFMLPMSIRCTTCGEFMGTGLKFNARKSNTNENYLGIRIYRFSMKCKSCPATFTIKTDPKNSDYICESGARRNYEPWREKEKMEEEGKIERMKQDEDKMQALENKTKDAKREMEDLDLLAEIKDGNAKRAAISVTDVLDKGRERQVLREKEVQRMLLEQAKEMFKRTSREEQTPLLDLSKSKLTAVSAASDPLPTIRVGLKVKVKKPQVPETAPKKAPEPLPALVDYPDSDSN